VTVWAFVLALLLVILSVLPSVMQRVKVWVAE
jgi:hypothetical protein